MYVAGIEIGGTKIQVVLGTPEGHIMERRRFTVSREAGAAGIQNQILEGLYSLKQIHAFQAIGVGFGGPIDWKQGRVFKSHHIEGWNGFELGKWLHGKFNVPVIADNDANVAALAEAKLGAGRHRNPVYYMTIGSGIGGGLVYNGSIYHGQYPGELEIGHTRIPSPDLPPHEWPILEGLCSGWSIDTRIRLIAKKHPQSVLARLLPEKIGGEAHFLSKAINEGDPYAERIWQDLTQYLALALSHIIHLFHPEILILGGGVTHLGQALIEKICDHLEKIVMQAHENTYFVELAKLGEDVVPIGALLLPTHAHSNP
jgi:glucokinase